MGAQNSNYSFNPGHPFEHIYLLCQFILPCIFHQKAPCLTDNHRFSTAHCMDVKTDIIDPNQNILQSVTPPDRATPDSDFSNRVKVIDSGGTHSPGVRPGSTDRKRPYPCDLCSSKFGSKMELEEHQNSHTGDKPFECNVCKARFNRRSTLWNHKRIHSDTKPFNCPICSMQFKWKNSLKCHREMHLRKNELQETDIDLKQSMTYASVTGGRRQASATPKANKGGSKKKRTEKQPEETLPKCPQAEINSNGTSGTGSMLQKALVGEYPPSDPVPSRFPGPQSLLSIAQMYPLATAGPAGIYSRPQTFFNVQLISSQQSPAAMPPAALLTPATTPTFFSPAHSAQGPAVFNGHRPLFGGVPAQAILDGSGGSGATIIPPPSMATPCTPAGGDYMPNVDFMLQQGLQHHQHGVGGNTTSAASAVAESAVSTQSSGPAVPTSSVPATSGGVDGGYIVKVLPYNEW